MSKIYSNAIAYFKGIAMRVENKFKKRKTIGGRLRVFSGSEVNLYRNSKCSIGTNVKIDKGTTIVACSGSELFIADNVGIGPQNRIICRDKICIGKDTIFGPNVFVYDHDHKFNSESGVDRFHYNTAEITIGEKCWIGAGVTILRGTHIGNRCLIAAGAVVKGDIPEGTILIQKRMNNYYNNGRHL